MMGSSRFCSELHLGYALQSSGAARLGCSLVAKALGFALAAGNDLYLVNSGRWRSSAFGATCRATIGVGAGAPEPKSDVCSTAGAPCCRCLRYCEGPAEFFLACWPWRVLRHPRATRAT